MGVNAMQIGAIGSNTAVMAGGTDAGASVQAAERAKFDAALKEAEQKLSVRSGELSPAEDKKLREACQGFEAMFLNIMYTQMRNTVPKNDLFGHDNADEILQSMRDTAMMNAAAESGGIGLAKMLYEQLKLDSKAIVTPK
ncbi:hypothetical protein TAMA11512_06670 [Selenomonas sp. TAMA-11512]|uniref:rod-binding protein n=1 Tax=Selenomonas sp. TAMA-11512 TaxID=3095337 RepID=UPI00308F7BF0|nr:hypothetical protein TAMA11512_06670 [Selenomonas sp. TAMA-11512]